MIKGDGTMEKELKIEGFDLKDPSRYVVSLAEFMELKAENAEEVQGLSYEEYCEIEREGWDDCVKAAMNKTFELLNTLLPGKQKEFAG